MRRFGAMSMVSRVLTAVVLVSSLVACANRARPTERPVAAPSAGAPPKTTEPVKTKPVPETLIFDAGRFGLAMTAEGWSWKVLRRSLTRFDWQGRPASGDREVLYSFLTEKLDAAAGARLPEVVRSVAATLTDGEPCVPVENPRAVVEALGVDRVISVCFEPSAFYGTEFRTGVLHGIVHEGALTIAVVLSNARAPAPGAPSSATLGARGRALSR